MTTGLVERIYAYYRRRDGAQPFRRHLGASVIHNECERRLWLDFRWAKRDDIDGRIYRLFETGQLEETRIIDNLSAVGCNVTAFDLATGKQFSFSLFGGHFGGSCDGKVSQIPGADDPTEVHILEMKTHNERSFKELSSKGVLASKPEHYWQMQVYMGFADLEHALYVAVNKNTDELYTERIARDHEYYTRAVAKAARVVFSSTPLPKVSESPSFFGCKFCNYWSLCHGGDVPVEANCRTCLHATPRDDGSWLCEHKGLILSFAEQLKGCPDHLYVPGIVGTRRQVNVKDGAIVYDGGLVNRPGGKWETD